MDQLCMKLYIKLMQAKQNFLEEERGAVDIVAIVVLIGVSVMLALFFRDQIKDVLEKMFDNILKSTSDMSSSLS